MSMRLFLETLGHRFTMSILRQELYLALMSAHRSSFQMKKPKKTPIEQALFEAYAESFPAHGSWKSQNKYVKDAWKHVAWRAIDYVSDVIRGK